MHSICSGEWTRGPWQRTDNCYYRQACVRRVWTHRWHSPSKIFYITQSLRFTVCVFFLAHSFWCWLKMARHSSPSIPLCWGIELFHIFYYVIISICAARKGSKTAHSSSDYNLYGAQHWRAEKKLHIINNVPINEIELNRMDLTRKKRNSQQHATHLLFESVSFFLFVLLHSPRLLCCILKFAIFMTPALYSTLSTPLCNLNQYRSPFFCVFTYSTLCSDVNILRPLFHYNSFAFWVIGCAVCTHSFVNSFCVSRARVCLQFNASILIQKLMNFVFHRPSSHFRTVDDFVFG